jgi:hypothetical protein
MSHVGTKRKCRNARGIPKLGVGRLCHPLPATAALDPTETWRFSFFPEKMRYQRLYFLYKKADVPSENAT